DPQIDETFNKFGGLNENDKISFITHSQGGIITLVWLYHTFLMTDDKYAGLRDSALHFERLNPQYFKHVRNFITLGTPFWGSKLAPIGLWMKNSCNEGAKFFKRKICNFTKDMTRLVGEAELRGVAF